MVPVSFGERDQARAIKIHAIKVNEIRILIGVLAAGSEPDLAIVFIDLINPANNKFSLRNLVFDSPFLCIHEVKVTPTVTLGDVDHIVGFFEPVDISEIQPLGVSGPNKGLALFIDQISQCTGLRIDFNDPISLVTTIDFYISKMAPVTQPVDIRRLPAVFVAVDFGFDLLASGDVEDAKLVEVQLLARQIVRSGFKNRASAAGWRGLHEINLLVIARFEAP